MLSGSVGVFLAWAMNVSEGKEDATTLAAYAGSTVTRTASRLCFARMKRGMQTADMLNDVAHAFEEVFGAEAVSEQDGDSEKGGRL